MESDTSRTVRIILGLSLITIAFILSIIWFGWKPLIILLLWIFGAILLMFNNG